MERNTSEILYKVIENKLVSRNTQPYLARVIRKRHLDRDALIDIMDSSNTTVSRQDIIVVFDLMEKVMEEQLLLGNTVSTNFFTVRAGIIGGFASAEDEYDYPRNEVRATIALRPSFSRNLSRNARCVKIDHTVPVPVIDKVIDYRSLAVNSSVSPGNIVEIQGKNLVFDREQADQGIFFKDENTGTTIRVDHVIKHTATCVVFMVPETVSAGTYALTVKGLFSTQVRTGRYLNEIQAA